MSMSFSSYIYLENYPRELVVKGAELHHFGNFNINTDELDRPIWVSDNYSCALQYKNFSVKSSYYTKLFVCTKFEIVNINGVNLQRITEELGIYKHSEFNQNLAIFLLDNGVDGIVYCGREIFIAEPSRIVNNVMSEYLFS